MSQVILGTYCGGRREPPRHRTEAGTGVRDDVASSAGATSDIRFPRRWSDWKNGIYIGSVAIGVLLPVFFFVVRP